MDHMHPFEVIRQEIIIRYNLINAEPLQEHAERSAMDENGVSVHPL